MNFLNIEKNKILRILFSILHVFFSFYAIFLFVIFYAANVSGPDIWSYAIFSTQRPD